ncbi:MAG: RING-HC finger protein [Candidatus Endonucleobacter bathymodioli]|uniref:RING-HC finger protein n=1 Tax=Candidatus Endonucleibacter bathymodioli TaxID=539814 RepID=A0AA90SMV5_9GAMM|nr:RING-HC finger protein [Candidatus Endonucleobacter bathymodioli]
MNLSVILMFFYCIGIAHNLFAIIENDIEDGLSNLSINAPDITIDGAANNYHIGNETTASNVGAIGEDDAVNSNEEVLKISLSAKEVIVTATNTSSNIPSYSTNPIPMIINDTAFSVHTTCTKCGKTSTYEHIYAASKAYIYYHTANKKRGCMLDDTNKPYAHIILFSSFSPSSDYTQCLAQIKALVDDPLSLDTIVDGKKINEIIQWTKSLLLSIDPVPTIGNNEAHGNSTDLHATIVDDGQGSHSNSGNSKDNNLINEATLLSSGGYSERNKESVASNPIDTEETNIPQNTVECIYPDYVDECRRRNSFDHPNWTCNQQNTADLAAAGFFYTGVEDIVRCFYCSLGLSGWNKDDDVWQEHAQHSADCWFLRQAKNAEYIDKIKKDWEKTYNPKHPQYGDEHDRLISYDLDWYLGMEPTPLMLATAGFFYTGENDTVRCHYCDGALRDWRDWIDGDDVWRLHAKFFPDCKFLILRKGCQFIIDIKNTVRADKEKRKRQEDINQQMGGFISSAESEVLLHSQEFKTDETIATLLETYSINSHMLASAIIDYRKNNHCQHFTVDNIIETIGEKNKSILQYNHKAQEGSASNTVVNAQKASIFNTKKLRKVNAMLKEKLKCRRCNKNDICMLFINCGHRVVCESCSKKIDFCPYCDHRIQKTIKTFLSNIGANKHNPIRPFITPIPPGLKSRKVCLAIPLLQNNIFHIT